MRLDCIFAPILPGKSKAIPPPADRKETACNPYCYDTQGEDRKPPDFNRLCRKPQRRANRSEQKSAKAQPEWLTND